MITKFPKLDKVYGGVFELNSKRLTIFIPMNGSLHIPLAEECYFSLLVT